MTFINLNKPKCYIYLIEILIIRCLNHYIKKSNIELLKTKIILRIFLLYISYSLGIIPYFIQNKISNNEINFKNYFFEKELMYVVSNHKLWFFFIFFLCYLTTTLSEFKYKHFFYNDIMKSFNKQTIENCEFIFLFFSCFLNEKYILNIKFYFHHFISLFFVGFMLLLNILFSLFTLKLDTNERLYSFICIIIISFQTQYLQSATLTISKKLNYEYFINMNLLLSIIGLFGITFGIIIYFSLNNSMSLTITKFSDILVLILYCIINSILYILEYKVLEETRPSYILMAKSGENLILNLFKLFLSKKIFNEEEKTNLEITLISFFELISFFIFSETLVLKFWNLDKYTRKAIIQRGEETLINDLRDLSSIEASILEN
jgi:hypothetical protein